MNILMVYPEFPDTFWSFKYALKFLHAKSAFPPLGLLTVASMLPKNWNVRLVDMNVKHLSNKDLKWADCVFLSAMAIQRDSFNYVVENSRSHNLPIIAGGPMVTAEPELFKHLDHLILNEAEVTFPEFLQDWKTGKAKHIYRSDRFPSLSETPIPAWHLINRKHYASMCIQYSRGCPFNCDFCNITSLFGRKQRTKPADKFLAELDSLWATGWRGSIFIVDDNLIGNKKRLKQNLLPALIKWRKTHPGLTFNTEVSINLADDKELMELMSDAGFDTVFIGIESPDENSLEECSKTQNTNRNMSEDIRRIQQAGLQVQGGFIVGFDHDDPSIFQLQLDFIQKTGIVTAMVGVLEALPGTKLYERLRQENRLAASETSGDNTNGLTNIIPKMNIDTLCNGYKELMRSIYSSDNYYQRLKTFLKNYKAPEVNKTLTCRRFIAFLKSIVRLGIISRERFHYWKLLIWTFFRRRSLFPLAISLLIYGHHFRKMCRLHLK